MNVRYWSRGWALLTLVIVVVSPLVGCSGKLPEPELPTEASASLGTLDPDWIIERVDGRKLAPGKLSGYTMFINVWAPWCGPCVREMPSIEKLRASLESEDKILFLIVSTEPRIELAKAIDEHGWDLPIFTTKKLPGALQTTALPSTYIVGGQGKVLYKHTGAADWDIDEARSFLKAVRDKTMYPPADTLQTLGTLDADWKLQTLDGKQVTARELRGKTVFVNLWATWCPPCVKEMPSIQRLYESVKNKDVAFVVASTEKTEDVEAFVKKKGWKLPIYTTERLPRILNTQGIPATFIVNAQGEVVFKRLGGNDWSSDPFENFLLAVAKK